MLRDPDISHPRVVFTAQGEQPFEFPLRGASVVRHAAGDLVALVGFREPANPLFELGTVGSIVCQLGETEDTTRIDRAVVLAQAECGQIECLVTRFMVIGAECTALRVEALRMAAVWATDQSRGDWLDQIAKQLRGTADTLSEMIKSGINFKV